MTAVDYSVAWIEETFTTQKHGTYHQQQGQQDTTGNIHKKR
ncbi:hypothetical protein FM120_15510 [Sphingobacterium faecium PCAi_F2.5]|nr:hypothetical protein FM120_15510 [Sphingobacterium faecium PCAi_F2.5]